MSQFNFYAFTNNFEDFKLPDRNAPQYIEIEEFMDNELSNNVAYELASRNEDVKNELQKLIAFKAREADAIIEYQQSNTSNKLDFEKFDYSIFFDYGFNQLAIDYLLFRYEARNYTDTKGLAHDRLLDFCKNLINIFGYAYEESFFHELLLRYTQIEDYFKDIFHQDISCKYIEKNGEIHNIAPFDGTYYDEWSDNPYNLTESSKDTYIFYKGLYTYKDDIFKREPVELGHNSYENILPTLSLTYSRPPMKNPYQNRHLYTEINLNLPDDEILSNVKRIIEIDRLVNNKYHIQEILNASNLFFQEYKSYERPAEMKKNELQVYYANMLYSYDTMQLFYEYLKKLKEKYTKGMEEIQSKKNKANTDGLDRKNQKQQLNEWYKEKSSRRLIQDLIYMEIFDCDRAPSNHQINALLTLAKKLIDKKEYRFLI